MKDYIVRYSYNHDTIESKMTISAESADQAKEKALKYTISRVISVKEKKSEKELEKDLKVAYMIDASGAFPAVVGFIAYTDVSRVYCDFAEV